MKHRRPLWALVLSALAWILWRKANRRPLVPVTPVVIAVAVSSQLRFNWNPLSWLGGLSDLGSGVVADIENWVKRAISTAIQVYDDAISPLLDTVGRAIWTLAGDVDDLYRWTSKAVGWINHLAEVAIPAAANWVLAQVRGWVDTLERWAAGALDAIVAWASAQINTLDQWASALVRDVIDPVIRWIDSAADWVGRFLVGWWDDIWASTFGPIWSVVLWLVHNVPHWIEWLANEAYGAVKLVLKAAGWLVWFGDHELVDLVHEIENLPRDLDRAFLRSTLSQGVSQHDATEQFWTDLLG